MKYNKLKYSVLMAMILPLALFSLNVLAAPEAANLHDPSGSFTGLLDIIYNSAITWDAKLRTYAIRVFISLSVIQLVLQFMPLAIRQADLGEIVGELVKFILTIGFFYALLLYSSQWAAAVINSFRDAAASAAGLSGRGIRPGDIFAVAIELANTLSSVETWNPLTATVIALAGLVVLLCFAFIAAFMAVTIIESYIVVNASVLFMGFGGSQWTREYALAIVRYSVSVGAKLFILTLIVGLIIDSAKSWQAAYTHDDASMWTLVGLALACAYLAKTIPDLVGGMISGVSSGGGSSLGGMAAAGAAGAAAAIATLATAGVAGAAAGAAEGASSLSEGLGQSLSGLPGGNVAGADVGASASTGMGGSSGMGSSLGSQTGGSASDAGTKTGGSTSSSSNSASRPNTALNEMGKSAAKESNEPSTKPAQQAKPAQNSSNKSSGHGRAIASGVTRAAGILSAISVPGMEGAAGLSLGSAPQPMIGGDNEIDMSAPQNSVDDGGEENIIRPDTQYESSEHSGGAYSADSDISQDVSREAGNE